MSRNSCQVVLGKGSEGWGIYSSVQVQKLTNCTVVRMAELSLGDLITFQQFWTFSMRHPRI